MQKTLNILIIIHHTGIRLELHVKDTMENDTTKNYYDIATRVIYNCFTDINKLSNLLLAGNKVGNEDYWKKLRKAREDIKYTRMKFGRFSPLVGLWADCANVDENLVRRKIIEFSIKYPNIDCLA